MHAVSQQSPSTQNPLSHWSGAPHAAPFVACPTQVPPRQNAPEAQSPSTPQVVLHAPASQAYGVHADAEAHWPVASQVSTPPAEHCVSFGAHTPEHAPFTHAWATQATGGPHWPDALHVSTPLPEHRVAFGVHTPPELEELDAAVLEELAAPELLLVEPPPVPALLVELPPVPVLLVELPPVPVLLVELPPVPVLLVELPPVPVPLVAVPPPVPVLLEAEPPPIPVLLEAEPPPFPPLLALALACPELLAVALACPEPPVPGVPPVPALGLPPHPVARVTATNIKTPVTALRRERGSTMYDSWVQDDCARTLTDAGGMESREIVTRRVDAAPSLRNCI